MAELVALVDTDRHDTDQPEPAWDKTLADWHQKLAELDPTTAPQDQSLVDAVITHLDCGIFDDEQEGAWRHYAYHAARRLYAPDDPRTLNATSYYAGSLQTRGLYSQALPLLHEVVTLRRRTGDIALLLLARAEYALALHATGCCHDAAREITSVWNLWRRDWTADTDLGGPLLDAILAILHGCDRGTEARDVLAHAPRAITVDRVRIRRGTGLINDAAEHASVCTYTADGLHGDRVMSAQPEPDDDPLGLDASVPQAARRYNALLGGKDNFASDRTAADDLIKAFPDARTAAAENRKFLQRVVQYLAGDCGIRQFLDIGVGLPVHPNVHDLAQTVDPTSRVAYVDNDPLVAVHARALLTSTPQGATHFVLGDLRQPQPILQNADLRATLNLDQPVAVLVVAVLHFITDTEHPYQAVRELLAAMPTGSYLAVSHGTYDLIPTDLLPAVQAVAEDSTQGPRHARTRQKVTAFANDLDLIEPGVVPVVDWHPDREPKPEATPAQSACYGFLARKP